MDHDREFDVSGIFGDVLLIVDGRELITIEDPSLSALGYKLLSPATSQFVGNNTYFVMFYSILVGHTFRTLQIHHWFPLLDRAPYLHTSHQSEILHFFIPLPLLSQRIF